MRTHTGYSEYTDRPRDSDVGGWTNGSGRENRDDLSIAQWLTRKLPPRDYLFQDLMSSTSRWVVIGETGIGKTLFLLEMCFAAAQGIDFLNWHGGSKPRRVMYLDGELPAETMKERIEAAEMIYGNPAHMWIYNRDVLASGDMPALNTPEGQRWLLYEVDRLRPDLIAFDAIMTLLIGSDEEAWQPMIPLIRQLSSRRIAQIWAHHTGHDANKGYGTKTREWEMDSVAIISKTEMDGSLLLEFKKARLRTPKTAHLFAPKNIARGDSGWTSKPAVTAARTNIGAQVRGWYLGAIDELSHGVTPERGHDNVLVRKIAIDRIRERMIGLGQLDIENGKVTSTDRSNFGRARKDLVKKKIIGANETHAWRIKT